MGQHRDRLNELTAGIDLASVQKLHESMGKWSGASTSLHTVAQNMPKRTEDIAVAFGPKSSVTDAATESFALSGKHLKQKGDELATSSTKLVAVATALHNAIKDKKAWDAADAKAAAKSSSDSTANSATPADHEAAAAAHVNAITAAYQDAIAELKKVVRPTRSELMTYTSVVLVFVLVVMAFVTLVDLGIGKVVFWVFGG